MYLLKAYEGLYKIHGKVCPKSGTHEPPCTLDSRNFRSQARGECLPKQALAYALGIIPNNLTGTVPVRIIPSSCGSRASG